MSNKPWLDSFYHVDQLDSPEINANMSIQKKIILMLNFSYSYHSQSNDTRPIIFYLRNTMCSRQNKSCRNDGSAAFEHNSDSFHIAQSSL